MDGENAQMAGLSQLEGVFHAFFAADFADTDDIGRLTHGALNGDFPVVGIDADFALGEDAAARFVDKLDGVFDGNDMAGQLLVAVVEHGGHGGGFTRTGRAGEDQQAARRECKLLELFGQTEGLHFGNVLADAAQYHADAALLVVGVDAVARVAARLDGIVDFPVAVEGFELVGVHGGLGDGGGVRAGQRFVGHGREGAADFDGRGKTCADEDVGCVAFFGLFTHAFEQGMKMRADFGRCGDVRCLVFL